ncbi:MAG: hypothetical protein IJB68_00975 [Ruminococcus sp.]|nr:hypothetical protein [Ruminococcus sp.]
MIKAENSPRKTETVYMRLAAAIVERAVIDFRSAVKHRDYEEMEQLKKFFTSDWFQMLCDIDGKLIIRTLEMEDVA